MLQFFLSVADLPKLLGLQPLDSTLNSMQRAPLSWLQYLGAVLCVFFLILIDGLASASQLS
jgi:hypothetical protein